MMVNENVAVWAKGSAPSTFVVWLMPRSATKPKAPESPSDTATGTRSSSRASITTRTSTITVLTVIIDALLLPEYQWWAHRRLAALSHQQGLLRAHQRTPSAPRHG